MNLATTPSASYGILFCYNDPNGGYNYAMVINNNRNLLYRENNSSSGPASLFSNAVVPVNTWTFLAAAFDGSNMRFYQDGTAYGTSAAVLGDPSAGSCFLGGFYGTGASMFDGALDEIRFSNAARSADWLKAEYNNQSSPGTFYSLSGEL